MTAAAPADAPRGGWLARLASGLTRSKQSLSSGLAGLLTKRKLDEETLEELQDLLISADLGVGTAAAVAAELRRDRYDQDISEAEVRAVLARQIAEILTPLARPLTVDGGHRPHVILVVGVNGTGKTTTIGKLAARFREQGKTVLLAAADTFRAAAIEQLQVWGERGGAAVIAPAVGADPAAVAFDALTRASQEGTDVVMIDTAGRLQNKAGLMAELEKIVRVMAKVDETAPHDVLLVLDATTGQNALAQVEAFRDVCGVSGLIMTKLDGTARGGILVALAQKFGLPVHAIGIGEGIDDLQPFDAAVFARALVGGGENGG